MESAVFEEKDFFACCGSVQFAKEMASAAPFSFPDQALKAARDIWLNKVDVNGWLEAFAAHPQIGESPSSNHKSPTSAKWSKGEQSAAIATATDSTLQELADWNRQYRDKFGFIFLICASGKSTPEILSEVKRRYTNRPIVEFEIAAMEQLKITELRLAKLFPANKQESPPKTNLQVVRDAVEKVTDRVSIIGSHIASVSSKTPTRTRPPITTHVLDIARGSPAAGIEVRLEMWDGNRPRLSFGEPDNGGWIFQGSSITDKDGRSGQLMKMVEILKAGMYRISFNTGKYSPDGFFPYVCLVFEVRDTQKWEHFHVPLLLSPFSFTTYRGS
ncbi:uric acid degradation bifunctional protein TTL isoform X2 [Impatiens glandulifera]|uniref:uric acid degradation bifunctional protein TTL isoform X2 n=1 Tax=Impatiens glandulifera TaxID=253017 RepID=UPI001FB15E71|nr:uric acid degradation bifunctional protein TTL isoform X2 [Impatiens glandulifera]